MGRITESGGNFECQVEGVYHECFYAPSKLQDIIICNEGKEKVGVPEGGRVFPYIAHYMTTGDLIYPAHEGEGSISSLLEELDRLNLVPHLFHNGSTKGETLNRNSKRIQNGDFNTKLCIRTRNERWDGVGKIFARIFKMPNTEPQPAGHPVYRPPVQNKGQTVVIVRSSFQGSAQIKVHGPSPLLEGLLPDARPVSNQVAHHHLNAHLLPSATTANSVLVSLEGRGFVVTVRSSWAEGQTGAVITQWLLFRRGSTKNASNVHAGSSKKTSSLSRMAHSSRKREAAKKTAKSNVETQIKRPANSTNSCNEKQIKKSTPLRLLGSSNSFQVIPDATKDADSNNCAKGQITQVKSDTLERPPSRWSSISENISNSGALSRSLNVISGSSYTLPNKKKKFVIKKRKRQVNTILKEVRNESLANEKEPKSKPIVAKWTKASIKKAVGKLF